jgi:hypothetical protein
MFNVQPRMNCHLKQRAMAREGKGRNEREERRKGKFEVGQGERRAGLFGRGLRMCQRQGESRTQAENDTAVSPARIVSASNRSLNGLNRGDLATRRHNGFNQLNRSVWRNKR